MCVPGSPSLVGRKPGKIKQCMSTSHQKACDLDWSRGFKSLSRRFNQAINQLNEKAFLLLLLGKILYCVEVIHNGTIDFRTNNNRIIVS